MAHKDDGKRFADIDLENKKLPPVGGYWQEELVSLKEAVKPVESLFNELDRSVKLALKHCKFPSEHGLTRDESAAIYLYTMEGGAKSFYKVLNETLREEDRRSLMPWFPFLKLIDTAFNKLPAIKGVLWRGIKNDVSGAFTNNQILTWWGISSCSQSLSVIEDFLDNAGQSTMFMIEAKRAKNISDYSYFRSENEVVLTLGTELLVKSKTQKNFGGRSVVHLVQLLDDDDDGDVDILPEHLAKINLKEKESASVIAGKQF